VIDQAKKIERAKELMEAHKMLKKDEKNVFFSIVKVNA
jgi:hypothetical protein